MIDIEEQDGEGFRVAAAPVLPDPIECVRHAIEEQRAIRQPGQRIVKGIVDELALGLPLLGDIAADAGDSDHARFRTAQHGVVPEDDAPLPRPRRDLHLDVCADDSAADGFQKSETKTKGPKALWDTC